MIVKSEISHVEVITGYKAKFVHTETMTLGFWEVEKGAVLPTHKHFHEQVTKVEEGIPADHRWPNKSIYQGDGGSNTSQC